MPADAAQLQRAATRFIEAEPQASDTAGLPQLLSRCAVHLVGVSGGDLDGADARAIALRAWAEVSGRESRCFVDLALSTPHLIYLRDGLTGRTRAIPVIDLVRWIGPRQVPFRDPLAPS